jgi:hypothetical protein
VQKGSKRVTIFLYYREKVTTVSHNRRQQLTRVTGYYLEEPIFSPPATPSLPDTLTKSRQRLHSRSRGRRSTPSAQRLAFARFPPIPLKHFAPASSSVKMHPTRLLAQPSRPALPSLPDDTSTKSRRLSHSRSRGRGSIQPTGFTSPPLWG